MKRKLLKITGPVWSRLVLHLAANGPQTAMRFIVAAITEKLDRDSPALAGGVADTMESKREDILADPGEADFDSV